jgi:hypothetical protein
MTLRLSGILLGCALGLTVAGHADAQPRLQPPGGQPQQQPQSQPQQPAGGIINGTTVELTARMMTEAGYTDVQFLEHQGRRHVRGKAGETPVIVIHDNCQNENCVVISFTVFFGEQRTIDAAYMNAWNQNKRWCKLYRAANGNLVFDMDAFVAGVQPEYVKAMSVIFANMLKQLFEFKPS